jgi:hypothetical protein
MLKLRAVFESVKGIGPARKPTEWRGVTVLRAENAHAKVGSFSFLTRAISVGFALASWSRYRNNFKQYRAAALRPGRYLFFLPVTAFGELLDHLLIECRNVIRFTACNETMLCYHFSIDPIGTGVLQVGF